MEISVFNANIEDPGQTPCSVTSDLGLHCLPKALLWNALGINWLKRFSLRIRILVDQLTILSFQHHSERRFLLGVLF